jgi:Tfp pilus assembly protein PilV
MATRTEGFSLVEVMVASFGVVLGLAGVLVAFSALVRTARMVNAEGQALHQARQQIEQLRTYSFASPELAVGTHVIPGGECLISSNSALTRRITVTQYAVTPNNATSRVSLTTVLTSVLHK